MAQFEPLLPEAGAHLWALRNQEKKDKDPEKQCDLVVVIIKSLFQQQYFKKKINNPKHSTPKDRCCDQIRYWQSDNAQQDITLVTVRKLCGTIGHALVVTGPRRLAGSRACWRRMHQRIMSAVRIRVSNHSEQMDGHLQPELLSRGWSLALHLS